MKNWKQRIRTKILEQRIARKKEQEKEKDDVNENIVKESNRKAKHSVNEPILAQF